MTVKEAERIRDEFSGKEKNATEEDVFMFTEAMSFLISKKHDPADMLYLGGYYYDQKNFDLALKYYEMSASYDYDPAYECLGYIWYYGRTGTRDHKKAFECFSRLREKGDPVATYKIADMYKNGYYVEKDLKKYEQMIEELCKLTQYMHSPFDPVPEILTRLAGIRKDQDRKDEAVELYLEAKGVLAERLKYSSFFGNISIMKWLIDDLYTLTGFDDDFFDLYDMFFLLKTPCRVTFYYRDDMAEAEAVMEGGECSICFNGRWYENREKFFLGAEMNGKKLTSIYDRLYGFEVERL